MCRDSATGGASHIRRTADDITSAGLAQGQVDPFTSEERMWLIFERQDAVIAQAVRATPDDYVAVMERNAHGSVGPLVTSEQEHGAHTEGHRNDGSGEVLL